MSLLDSSRSEAPASTAVVAAAVLVQASGAPLALDALARQVYGPSSVFVVGGGDEGRRLAEQAGCSWVDDPRALFSELPRDVTHVWFLHDDARPRPDALVALIGEAERVDASVAGSKLLVADRPEVLESVGAATDVFDVPYFGLEPDEVDQQQYDVIRDVAFVSAASLLVRRDLLRGLGGPDPELAPEAASIDFCQRARLAGSRVVVAPSSEVLHAGSCRSATPPWREEAGRLRAMMKAYGPITLTWALPLAFLVGLVQAVFATFLGRPAALPDFGRAWGWNLLRLPGTWRGRQQARRFRLVGDEQLFRFQLRGSSQLRRLAEEVGERVRARAAQGVPGPLVGLVELGQDAVRHPAVLSLLAVAGVCLVATREIWVSALPVVGYALPPGGRAWDTLRAYAGGWNSSGLGSPEPLRPAVAVTALVQLILFGRSGLTAAVLTVGSVVGGAVGTARLLRRFGVNPYARYAGGLVLVGGPPARFALEQGHWPALPALALVPWVVLAALRPWPSGWRGRVGRVALVGLVTGVAAAYLPTALLVPTVALAMWALVGDGRRWAVVLAALGAAVGVWLLFPWLEALDPTRLWSAGRPLYWTPSWWTVVLAGGAAVVVMAGGDRRLATLAGWGAVLAALGAFAARAAAFGVGTEVGVAGLLTASLGMAVLAGSSLEMWTRAAQPYFGRRSIASLAALAGIGLVASTLLWVASGRAGLPDDQYREALRFTAVRQAEGDSSRALLLGPVEALPGDARLVDGMAYRLVSVPVPGLEEAWLPEPLLGDRVLEEMLRGLAQGGTLRLGESLAPFGVRWIVVVGPSPLQPALEVQLDLHPLSGLLYPVFENEVPAHRAVAEDGTPWEWTGAEYRGPAREAGRVYLAENGHQRWSPAPWEQAGWANEVSAATGRAAFSGIDRYRLIGLGVAALAALLIALAWWGRGEEL